MEDLMDLYLIEHKYNSYFVDENNLLLEDISGMVGIKRGKQSCSSFFGNIMLAHANVVYSEDIQNLYLPKGEIRIKKVSEKPLWALRDFEFAQYRAARKIKVIKSEKFFICRLAKKWLKNRKRRK